MDNFSSSIDGDITLNDREEEVRRANEPGWDRCRFGGLVSCLWDGERFDDFDSSLGENRTDDGVRSIGASGGIGDDVVAKVMDVELRSTTVIRSLWARAKEILIPRRGDVEGDKSRFLKADDMD